MSGRDVTEKGGGSPPRRRRTRGRSVALGAMLVLLAGTSVAGFATFGGRGPLAGGPPASATASPSDQVAGSPTVAAAPTAETATASPSAAPVRLALVPVVAFWASERAITTAQLRHAIAGGDSAYSSVVVQAGALRSLASALGVAPGRGTREGDAATVRAAVRGHAGVLGMLRADAVTPDVRALAVDGHSLFGVDRIRALDGWPLLVSEPAGTSPETFDLAATWTIVAAGDVMLDREVYQQSVVRGKGADWPWAGGTARITGRYCCDDYGGLLPTSARTGNEGPVRALFRGADLAMVNLEGPAPDAFSYHPGGFVFTMDPALLAGLADAGIDFTSLGNNHIGNAGGVAVSQTIEHLDALGIGHAGGGASLAAARRPAWYTVGGLRVAVLAYNGTGIGVDATASRAGAAPLMAGQATADIKAARAAGADLVVVWPHWGTEYTAATSATQRALARTMVEAGADLVLGDHGHWAGALQAIGSSLVLYDLGDFIFDLVHSVQTEEGLVVELTYRGRRLVQVDLHPTLSLERGQPNLLDPAADGRSVLEQVRLASRGLLGW